MRACFDDRRVHVDLCLTGIMVSIRERVCKRVLSCSLHVRVRVRVRMHVHVHVGVRKE